MIRILKYFSACHLRFTQSFVFIPPYLILVEKSEILIWRPTRALSMACLLPVLYHCSHTRSLERRIFSSSTLPSFCSPHYYYQRCYCRPHSSFHTLFSVLYMFYTYWKASSPFQSSFNILHTHSYVHTKLLLLANVEINRYISNRQSLSQLKREAFSVCVLVLSLESETSVRVRRVHVGSLTSNRVHYVN